MLYTLTPAQARLAAFALTEEAARCRKRAAHRVRQAQAIAQAHNRLGLNHAHARLRLDQAAAAEGEARAADTARAELVLGGL